MEKSLRQWADTKLSEYRPRVKVHVKKYLWKTALVFLIVFGILITLDLVSKDVVFNGDTSGTVGPVQADWGFIGFRSQFHKSTTFLDFIGASLPRYASLIIDYLLIVIFITLLVFNRRWWIAIAISLALTGVIGNTIDATYFYGVRNVLYIPYAYRGVFNFADIYIVVGTPLIVISFFTDYLITAKKIRDEKKALPAAVEALEVSPKSETPQISAAAIASMPGAPARTSVPKKTPPKPRPTAKKSTPSSSSTAKKPSTSSKPRTTKASPKK